MRRLIIRPEAEADITEAALWYEERESGLGRDLMGEVRIAIGRVLQSPLLFPCLRRHPEVPRVLTHRFPYRIFFIVRADALVVFAILHAARHERHWRRRI